MINDVLTIARAGPAASTGLAVRPLALAALISWLLTASLGGYMLRTWITRGGLRNQRTTGVGVPPAVVFGHAGAAAGGLAAWVGYVATAWVPLAWLGLGTITAAIALGISTVALWTPYPLPVIPPGGGPGGHGGHGGEGSPPLGGFGGSPPDLSDAVITRFLANPFPASRRPRLRLAPLIPVGHGFAALATFMLAMLTAVSARLGMVQAQ
jgi:hypothetical protein